MQAGISYSCVEATEATALHHDIIHGNTEAEGLEGLRSFYVRKMFKFTHWMS